MIKIINLLPIFLIDQNICHAKILKIKIWQNKNIYGALSYNKFTHLFSTYECPINQE